VHAAGRFAILLLTLGVECGPRPALALPPPVVEAPVPLETTEKDELALTLGVRSERSSQHAELSGFLALSVPLERLAAPRAALSSESAPLSESEEPARERAAAGDGAPEPVLPVLLAADLSRLCRDSVAAALRAAGLPEQQRDLSGMAARSRSSALLPELRLRVARAQDEALRLTPTADDPYRFTQDGGDDLVLEARGTWKLDRLIFADEEIAIGRLGLERERMVERLSARIVSLVIAWHHAVSGAQSQDEKTRSRAEFERLEAEVTLDVATGGWFRANAERTLRPQTAPAEPRRRAATLPASAVPERARGAPTTTDLVRAGSSAKPAEPCLPMHVTASKTSCGVSMR
jgi:hypothetical protein